MRIRFGYACISKTLNITSSHTITYTNYLKLNKVDRNVKLDEIINKNLDNLKELLLYNIKNNIHFFRMTSNLFPLASHPDVFIDIEKYRDKLIFIGCLIRKHHLRVDIHLDEYCVLNSTNSDVVVSTINIIKFYQNMFDIMNINSYMVIHVGSSVLGKKNSISRFVNNFYKIGKGKDSLIIENDDKVFNVIDIINISHVIKVPLVLDYHHFLCNNDGEKIEDYFSLIFDTWTGIPKIHYSSPKSLKEKRSHSDYINGDEFIDFLNKVKIVNRDIDIMLEVKEKDLALFKLVSYLKYKGYKFIDETTLEI